MQVYSIYVKSSSIGYKYKYKYPDYQIFLHDCHIIRVNGTGTGTGAVIIIGIFGGGDFGFDVVKVSGVGLMVVHFDGMDRFFFCYKGKER